MSTHLDNHKKKILSFVIGTLMILFFSYSFSLQTGSKKGNALRKQCKNISADQALKVVKNLPEVKQYLKGGRIVTNGQISTTTADVDHVAKSLITVHVYSDEQYPDEPGMGHAATFNWYSVDKCDGKIKCSFAEYNSSGEYIRNNDSFPCD